MSQTGVDVSFVPQLVAGSTVDVGAQIENQPTQIA